MFTAVMPVVSPLDIGPYAARGAAVAIATLFAALIPSARRPDGPGSNPSSRVTAGPPRPQAALASRSAPPPAAVNVAQSKHPSSRL